MSETTEEPSEASTTDEFAHAGEGDEAEPRPSIWRRLFLAFQRFAAGLALFYLVAICLIGVLSRGFAERFWWTTILLYAPQGFYLIPLIVTAPLAALARSSRALALNAAVAAAIGLWLMDFNVPRLRFPPPANAPRVRLLAYNIKGGVDGFELLGAQIDRYQPDVVVFSEALGWADDDATRRFFKRKLAGWNSHYAQEVYIASRWPLVEEESRPLGPDNMKYQGPQRRAGRVVVQAPFGTFQVMGAHFYTSMHGWTLWREKWRLPRYLRDTAGARRLQANQILDWHAQTSGPTLVAGDFNTPPRGLIYDKLTARFTDVFREAGWGWGYTYPSKRPLLRIDYIFHSPHWSVSRCEVGPAPGSDHRPFFAELALTSP